MKTPAKRTSITSILAALIVIASFLSALVPQAASPHPVYAASFRQVFYQTPSGGTWTVPSGVYYVTVLVVAGGGGGGGAGIAAYQGGGGGAGGLIYNASYPVTPGQTITVTVGAGGSGGTGNNRGNSGSNSVFGTLTAIGGGGGGGGTTNKNGASGGSGGGGGSPSATSTGGPGTSGQGNQGGNGVIANNAGGGGGGNGSVGENGGTDGSGYGGDGGSGAYYGDIFGTDVGASGYFAAGGGGGGYNVKGDGVNGSGNGGKDSNGADFTVNNSGSGGGGAGYTSTCCSFNGGKGAYGIVIVKYYALTTAAGSHGTVTTPGIGTYGYSYNKVVSIVATPDSCYHFVNWTGDTGTIANANSASTTITMSDNYSITANFAINTCTLSVTPNNSGGSPYFDGSSPFNCGASVTIHANKSSGYTFSGWSPTDGIGSPSSEDTTVSMTQDRSLTASYTASNAAPTITSITLQQSDKNTSASSMTPQVSYNIEIVAGDANTINDINQIDIWIFRDDNAGDDGAPSGSWDADHEAIYRWAKSGSTWSMQNNSATTTWSITTGSCDTPGDMGATSGEWNLYFTVGKLAQEANGTGAEWDIKVTVTDSASQTASSTIYSKSMGAYSSLSLSSSTINFGSIALGGTAAIQTPDSHYVTLVSISNDTFSLASKSSSPWTSGGNSATLDTDGSPGSGYFSLTLDDAGDGSGHPTTPQYITTSTADITGHTADTRTSTAAGTSEGTTDSNVYMDCILGSSGLKVLTYSGTITFTITNS